MAFSNRITRSRRTYNKWVANETFEDFALRFTAQKARKWSIARIANTAIGAVSFLALEAIGGSLMLSYGFSTALAAILTTSLVICLLGIPISYNCAKYGVDIDLLTRGSGFGYLGSTITSLIYASFTFIFFAIEAAIMATALEVCFSIPLSIGYLISTLIFIPLVTHGISLINKIQTWTQPIWIILQLLPFIFVTFYSAQAQSGWDSYTGLLGPVDGNISLVHFGAASAVLFSLTAQIGEQVDYLRFLPAKTQENKYRWWLGLLAAGPGWIIFGALKVIAGCFLAYFAFRSGVGFEASSEPTNMYLTAYGSAFSNPGVVLGVTGIFIVICQLKINVTNTYAGSIAWSNFFSRLTHSHPGRVVWVIFNVIIGLLLVELGAYRALEKILSLYSIVAVAWLATIVSDLVINKPLGLAPKGIEFKRAYLYDINPVGIGATIGASLLSLMSYFGFFGDTAEALYAYIALVVPFILSPSIAYYTKGKYYLARQPDDFSQDKSHLNKPTNHTHKPECDCSICQFNFEIDDMVHCPHYGAQICSLCCSLDVKCGDSCKTNARFHEQAASFIQQTFPKQIAARLMSRTGRYFGTLSMVVLIIGLIMSVIFYQAHLDWADSTEALNSIFINLLATSVIVAGIAVWLFLLAYESRVIAENEAQKHTELLEDEITAHEETDRQLQKAKEVAESANLAKSKYVIGLSHELRTPLNSILGYAQLMERQTDKTKLIENASRTIRRSGEHLAGLIEGLLDISKIEAGKIQISREKTAIISHFNQLVDMISPQASAKNLAFNFQCSNDFPSYVYADERRLRQVLINLLSNAVKFTNEGSVNFRASYRNQIATIEIEDTGSGIANTNLERIFLLFERIENGSSDAPPGTGLGLTITKLLVEIMGGDLQVESTLGEGTKFTIRLMLSSVPEILHDQKPDLPVKGYKGPRLAIAVADDDPLQRQLMKDTLAPLGFSIIEYSNGVECLNDLATDQPNLLILDIGMPDMDGWEVMAKIRSQISVGLPILVVSADAGIEQMNSDLDELNYGYLMKPVEISNLIHSIGLALNLSWKFAKKNTHQKKVVPHAD